MRHLARFHIHETRGYRLATFRWLLSPRMKIARLPLLALPAIAIAVVFFAGLFSSMIDQAHLRGAYQVWQENETFAAATIALLAALLASRPVYLQVRAQSVQAALDLLHRTEADTEACIDARKTLFELRRAVLNLSSEINAYAAAQEQPTQHLKEAIAALKTITPKDLVALAERPTINSADQMKLVALSCVLSLAQQVAADILAGERAGVIAQGVVAK
jgi:predicted Zn-dependent peptidase